MGYLRFTLALALSMLIAACASTGSRNGSEERSSNRVQQAKEPSLREMNDPEYLLQHGGPWVQDSTEHFDFYFYQGVSPQRVEQIKAAQEANYTKVVRFMGLAKDHRLPRIRYWLFRNKAEKARKTKVDGDAHTITSFASVYHTDTQSAIGAQEVGHILTVDQWGFISNTNGFSLLVEEGFNIYIDEEDYWVGTLGEVPYDSLAVFALTTPEHCPTFTIVHLAREGEDNEWGTSQARMSGAFIQWLIETYGIGRFAALWRESSRHEATNLGLFSQIYGKELERLAQAFYEYLGLREIACEG